MVKRLLILFCLLPSPLFALNTYPLTDSNLTKIEQDFKDAKSGYWPVVRINVTPAEMFAGGRIHFELLDKLKEFRAKYSRKICALLYTDCAPQGFWVNQISNPSTADFVFTEWLTKGNTNWKKPEGLAESLEQPVIEAQKAIADYLKPDWVQIGNEEGDTVNANRSVWTGYKPGSINPRFKSFQKRLVDALKGHQIISTSWETEDEPTFRQQVDSGEGFWIRDCQVIGQNQYFVRWEAGDTPEKVAARFWPKVRECSPYRQPVAVTEMNVPGVPPELEMATLIAIRKTKPSWVKFACPYFWSRA